MKICVLGAGVIGVSTAFALARLGHDVSVIDKAEDIGTGASQANGAQLSYSYIDPLSSPATFKKLPRYLLGFEQAMQFRFIPSLDYISWGTQFLFNCKSSRFQKNRNARKALAEKSLQAFESFEQDLPKNALKHTGVGKLVIAQSQSDCASMRSDPSFKSREECLSIEPALKHWNGHILGGLYTEDDYALDTQTYLKALKTKLVRDYNIKFFFNEDVKTINLSSKQAVQGILTQTQFHHADKVIMCLGNNPNPLLKPLGLKIPLYPIQGYSLTLPTSQTHLRTSVTDLKNKVVYANLGDRIRIAGFADANLHPSKINARIQTLLSVAKESWPDIANFDTNIDTWTQFRPMTPSGVPIIGETKIKGLYLNGGHGSLGYTFAPGSAMKIAELIGHARKNRFDNNEGYYAA